MATLKLSNSTLTAEIDDEDLERCEAHRWYLRDRGYVASGWHGVYTTLHQFIMGSAPDGKIWDHWDRDKLNNHKDNIRAATHSQSNANRGVFKANKLGVKGVDVFWKLKKFRAQIAYQGKKIHIGYYSTLREAKTAYNLKAQELFGAYASGGN